MQLVDYSHQTGRDTIGTDLCQRLEGTLKAVTFNVHRNCARDLRAAVLSSLTKHAWSDEVQIDSKRKLTITAMHGRIGLCLQTGNMARFYADLLKLQTLFLDKTITAAFYLIPTRSCARIMGDNIAHYERLTAELSEIFDKVITVPMVVIGFENMEKS